jgi:glycosyltransferase involved in cell wall biosynthesis
MMSRRGHEIIHYGHRNSVVECAELVPVVEPETYDTLYGNVHDIRNNQYVTHGDDHPLNALISGNTIYEISKRKRPGDYLLIFGGFWNKKIADAHGDMIIVEPAIGYPGSFSNFKVYPSYAYLHSFIQDANLPVNHYHVVIPHYFDVDDFDPHQPKEDYFLFVGRLNFDKGITLAIDLTAKIGARLKVCGQGNFQALGYEKIPDHVDFIGYVGVEKRKELMAKAKCVIMPTIYMEPFGCVVIESLLSGTPILTHDWGGPGENNIHGVTGFKCRTFEQFEWAARNIHLIEPKKCREWAEKNFSFDKIGLMYEEYFQSLQGGLDWYKPNLTRTNLDHLKKEYPVSSKWCVVVFAYGDIFYAPDSKRVLEDYFRFHGIPYYFVTEKPYFDTKDAHPSWWKLKVHSIVRGYDFIITWDLDLLPRNRHVNVIQDFDMTKICMVRDSTVSDTEDGYFKYNGGLIGIPKTYQSFMANIFDAHAPGVLNDYEQYYLNNQLFQTNAKIHELPRKLNGLYGTQYFPDALLQHYTYGHQAKYRISEHRQMYFQEYDTRIDMIRSLVPKHGDYAEIGVFEGEFSKELFSVLEPRKLHLIDLFTGNACSGDKDGNNGKWVNLDDVFQNLMTHFPSNVIMYKGPSYNVLEGFEDDSLDMIYIDGDHEYEGVRKDLEMAHKKVKSGGWIMGHDYEMNMKKAQVEYTFGVKRAVDEFCKEKHQTIHAKAFDGCVSWAVRVKKCRQYTLTSLERQQQVIEATEYIIKNNIAGDFIEIGVWKGGIVMMILYKLLEMGVTDRDVHLYDTFSGMTECSVHDDVTPELFEKAKCEASYDEVYKNISSVGYPMDRIHFHVGDIRCVKNAPAQIALLRLDNDWYELYKYELPLFEPHVQKGGIIIADDYGHWKGCKKAIDEYIEPGTHLNIIDYTGVWWIK